MLERRVALIPVVGPHGGAIACIAAGDERDARHDLRVADLQEDALGPAGLSATAAAHRVRLRGGRWPGRATGALYVDNPKELSGLYAENSGSAELGVALALVMYRAQSSARAVLATGTLALSEGSDEVSIGPVCGLKAKLRIVAEHFSRPGAAPPPRLCLVPERDLAAGDLNSEIGNLRTLGIKVQGVKTLADAARRVGARRRALHPRQRAVRRLFALACAWLIAWGAWTILVRAPIPLKFTALVSPDGTILATPARSRDPPGSGWQPPCRLAGSDLPGFVIGERIAMRLSTGGESDLLAWLLGYQHALVSISTVSGLKVLLPGSRRSIPPGMRPGYQIEVREPEEETLFAWLARRGWDPFDAVALEAELHRSLGPLKPPERMNAARNLLKDYAPGVLFYSFRSIAADACR